VVLPLGSTAPTVDFHHLVIAHAGQTKIAPYGAVTEEKQGQKGFSYDKMYEFPEYYAIRADSIVQKIGILLLYVLILLLAIFEYRNLL
jgi:hypothetical protein